jgi:hypothetical protein
MILTETGLHFRCDGDRWRCVEYPALVMLPGSGYEVAGQQFDMLAAAVAHQTGAAALPSRPTDRRHRHR